MAKITYTTETVTPAMAEQWLEKNKDNRPVRDHHTLLLAKEMREGRWQLNGEAIVFDFNGNLLDGQHRLWAAYEHGQTFETLVVRGVDPSSFQTIDGGMKRSAGDVLTKAGLTYGTLTAAALRLVHFYETGARDYLIVSRMSNAETLEMAAKYPRIQDAVAIIGPSAPLKRLCSLTSLAAFTYFALEADKDRAEAFIEALATGEELKRGDARLTCRNYFINLKQRGGRLHHRIQFALLIKAWNAHLTNRDLTVLKFLDGEEFPQFAHRTKARLKVAA